MGIRKYDACQVCGWRHKAKGLCEGHWIKARKAGIMDHPDRNQILANVDLLNPSIKCGCGVTFRNKKKTCPRCHRKYRE